MYTLLPCTQECNATEIIYPNQLDYKISKDEGNKTHTHFALKNWLWTCSLHTKIQEFKPVNTRILYSRLQLKLQDWFKFNIWDTQHNLM